MIYNNFFRLGLLTLIVFCLGHARLASAEQPMDQIKNAIERVSTVLGDVSAKRGANKAEAVERIRQILLPSFDFAEMAKRSLGERWENLDGKQNEFVSAFAGFVENSYMNTLASYRGEKILYLRERVNQNLAQVDTQVVASSGNPLSVDYRLHLVAGDWKVYDVIVDHISLVSNFHSQFNRILASASFDELLKKLREKGNDRPA
ncbi:MAG TPA: ABC transporter substrate-binding protein [Candidatus Binatia bacterium]